MASEIIRTSAKRCHAGQSASNRVMVMIFITAFGFGVFGSVVASEAERNNSGSFSIVVENDFFTGSDNNYTNGVGVSWASAELSAYDRDSFVRKWGEFWSFLPGMGGESADNYVSWTIGQEMHTPDDIRDPNPPRDDQPYAGVLYLDSTLYSRHDRWHQAWSLRLGVVGPASGAESTQREYHELIGADEPKGWDTQLPDEPIVNISYTVGYEVAKGRIGSASWRLVPIGTASLGNYATSVGGGVYTEVGWNLPPAMGISALRNGMNTALTVGAGPQKEWSVSFFAGGGAYGVAHYLPLDGTVFRDSRSVGSEPLIGVLSGGVAIRRDSFAASLGISYFTDTFGRERQGVNFGTLNFAWYL